MLHMELSGNNLKHYIDLLFCFVSSCKILYVSLDSVKYCFCSEYFGWLNSDQFV